MLAKGAAALACSLALVACSGNRQDAEMATAARAAQTVPTRPAAPRTTAAARPVAAATPSGLADQLAEVETAIRNPGTTAADLPRLGQTQDVVYRALVVHPELQEDVLARLPATLRDIAAANVSAGTELRRLSAGEPRELPKWHIVAPPPPAELLAQYRSAESATGVPWQYLAAIHLVETRMGRIRGDSSAGAQGPMQFLPSTWATYGGGGDIDSFHDAILAAARLLRANGAPADMANALYRYNPSDRYVRAITAYAEQMVANERAFLGYYHWQVYYFDTWLPEGYVG